MPAPITCTYLPPGRTTPIKLEMAELASMRQRAVMSDDGVRLLYYHITAEIRFCVTRTLSQPAAFARPEPYSHRTSPAGLHPAEAMAEISRLLLVPRGVLIVKAASRTVLESPQRTAGGTRMSVDANVGPIPLEVVLDDVLGDGLIFAVFRVQTWIAAACVGTAASPSPTLLSNQWQTSIDVQFPEFLETRTTKGRAVFRNDALSVRTVRRLLTLVSVTPLVPADFLSWILPPQINGYTRSVSITPSSDGTSLDWSVVDSEVPLRWGINTRWGVSACDGQQAFFFDTGLLFTRALGQHVTISVTGYPATRTSQLVLAIIWILTTGRNRNGAAVQSLAAGAFDGVRRQSYTSATMTVDFPRRHASLSISGRITGRIAGAAGIFGGSHLDNLDLYYEDLGPTFGHADTSTRAANPGPAEPFVGLMHAALAGVCDTPEQPGPSRNNVVARP